MREVLDHYGPQIAASSVLARLSLSAGGYFLVSAHREENVDDPARLARLLACLRAVRDEWGLPVLVSTHPRTRKRLELCAVGVGSLEGIVFHEPFGFFDYVKLQTQARCVLSDSGTISEESAILGFPAVTLRDSIERPEALECGAILLTGLDAIGVVESIRVAVEAPIQGRPRVDDYRIPDTSLRVVNSILSTVRRHHAWSGVRTASHAQAGRDV
jgi:UDP-N-acetylglucosamine 2-epimerase (non-hydrolysing)